MRKIVVGLLLLLTSLQAAEIKECTLWKFFRFGTQSILITDQFEVWELNYLLPNNQTWREWFNRITPPQIAPEFLFKNKDWEELSIIRQIHYPWSLSKESIIYRHDTRPLLPCTHLLENTHTQDKAFARQLDTEKWGKIYPLFASASLLLHEHLHPAGEKLLNHQLEIFKFCKKILFEKQLAEQGHPYDAKYVEFDDLFHFVEIVFSKSL